MKQITHEKDYYQGFRLCKFDDVEKDKDGFYVEILESIISFLDYVSFTYSKAFFVGFELNYPRNYAYEYPTDNYLFSMFIENHQKYYKSQKFKPMYFWARERTRPGQFHYHLILVFDGNKIRNGWVLKDRITQQWAYSLGIDCADGLVDLDDRGDWGKYAGIMLKRYDKNVNETYDMCFERMSYLGKAYSKGKSPANVKEYGRSQIPRNYRRWKDAG